MTWHEIKYRLQQQEDMSAHCQFKGTDEPVICASFGCGRVLTLTEQLAGSKCTGCMAKKSTTFKHYNH